MRVTRLPEATVHLGKLQTDVASANNDQVFRQDVEVHHAGVRQAVDVIEPWQRRHVGARSDVDEDLLRFEPVLADTNPVRVLEARVALVDGAVVREP